MAIHTQFARSALAHKGGGWEPQRKNHFAAIIYGVGGTNLSLQLNDTDLPDAGFVKQGIKYFNETSHYAGAYKVPDDWTLNYNDYIDQAGLETLTGWLNQVGENGSINNAAVYKKCGEILIMTPDGETHRKFVLEGVFPTSLKLGNFDHSSEGEKQMINLTCSVDVCRPPGRN